MQWDPQLKATKTLDLHWLREFVVAFLQLWSLTQTLLMISHWFQITWIKRANHMLEHVETAATEVGLHITTSKTEYKLAYNLRQQGNLTTLDNSKLRKVDDFKYLSSWIDQTKKDLEIRKGEAWSASNKLTAVWKSNLSRDLKICFPRASVESVLLNRSESWTLRLLLWKNNLMAATQGCYVLL